MSSLFVGLSAGFECASEIQGPQFLNDISHVSEKLLKRHDTFGQAALLTVRFSLIAR